MARGGIWLLCADTFQHGHDAREGDRSRSRECRAMGRVSCESAGPRRVTVGELSVSDCMSRYSYPFSVEGKRFMDEGENHFGLTHAKTDGAIGQQPEAKAFQVFDQKILYLLEPQYNEERSLKWQADSFEELGEKMGVDVCEFCTTMKEYNEATETVDSDPTRLDGLSAGAKLKVPKTHWALPLDKPPYMAYGVTCGMGYGTSFVSCISVSFD